MKVLVHIRDLLQLSGKTPKPVEDETFIVSVLI